MTEYVLTVNGRDLAPLLSECSGPGFIDWRPNWDDLEHLTVGMLLRPGNHGGASLEEARKYARGLRERIWMQHEKARSAAAEDPHRCPLDFNKLVPIPDQLCYGGKGKAAEDWCLENWGCVDYPRHVGYKLIHKRQYKRRGMIQVAVFTFTVDLCPTGIWREIMRRWPEVDALCQRVKVSPLTQEIKRLAA